MSEKVTTTTTMATKPADDKPAGPVRPRIPDREPKGEADWLVTVRHSPIFPATLVATVAAGKGLVIRAGSKAEAWRKFLFEAEAALKSKELQYRREPGAHQRALEWLRQAKLEIPAGAEVIGLEYVEARKRALRVKGTTTVEQIGFEELASA